MIFQRTKSLVVAGRVLAAIACALCISRGLIAQARNQTEQSEFGIELDAEPIQRPVEIPRPALDVLSKDERVKFCLEKNHLSASALPSNWFVGSEIHLDGPDEPDLVILPSGRLLETPAGQISKNACLIGANTAQMWVLRNMQADFQLVLSQVGLGMNVLATRTHGFRDIQVGAAVGGYADAIDYKFDGTSYQIARRTSELIRAKIPDELSGYDTRKPFIQLPDQTPESIRASARAWIWERLGTHKAYVTVTTRDEEGDETMTYYITPDEKGEWEVIIHAHRGLRSTQTQGPIIEDELSIATEVDRARPGDEDAYPRRAIADSEHVPASNYRLRFLDYREVTIGTL